MRPVILDCNNLCHIQRHAFGEELSYQDELTGIMWGFMYRLLTYAKQFDTRFFLFCWDSQQSYRKLEYANYKGNREEKTQGQLESSGRIYAQFDKLKNEILPSIGFRNIYHRIGWEADDIMAEVLLDLVVGIAMGHIDGQPIIVSTDKDLYQLLDHCVVYRPLPGDKKETITYKIFRERYGITPQQWTHVRACEGDTSDNIPGVKGIGIKKAIKFIRGDLKGSDKARVELAKPEVQAAIKRNVSLMTLPYAKLPRPPVQERVTLFPIDNDETLSLDAFIKVCRTYSFESFLKADNLDEWRTHFALVG